MSMGGPSKTIILSPLDWGLGHASRCIPIARELIRTGFEPVLAGSGQSLELISKEFPELRTYELPSYNIRYPERSAYLKEKLILQIPSILKTVKKEYELTQGIVEKEKAAGIISDNRFGVRSNQVESVYLTHQLLVKAGWLTGMATSGHRSLISKFDRCWICDYQGEDSLAGQLSNASEELSSVSWIGPLSRFNSSESIEKDIDITVVLSGPEPSRSLFEESIRKELQSFKGRLVLVRGLIEKEKSSKVDGNKTEYNFLLSDELQTLMKRSKLIISRSGYSSVMDLNALGGKALLVPTPGQGEQEYLAQRLQSKGVCASAEQASFNMEAIEHAMNYPGFQTKKASKNELSNSLFDAFL